MNWTDNDYYESKNLKMINTVIVTIPWYTMAQKEGTVVEKG